MLNFRLTITSDQRQSLDRKLAAARQRGNLRLVKFILAIFAAIHYQDTSQAALVLQLSLAQVERYVHLFLCYGVRGVAFKPSSGRPKLTKAQQHQLCQWIDAGPQACGLNGDCWRSPMIQQLIKERFGVSYSIFYIAELLRNLGFRYQKAAFVSDHLNEIERRRFRQQIWPKILRLARAQQALLLFGDGASFPQWAHSLISGHGRAASRWSGHRASAKATKVFGLIDYFSGRFFHQGQEGRLNSTAYIAFLRQELEQTSEPLILIQDGARYHASAETKGFFAEQAERLTVYQLPGYSPDYNPIEKLWKKLKEQETHLHYFPTFAGLTAEVEQALIRFAHTPQEILSLCSLPEELAWAA